jgi:DNA processing protein
MIGPDAGSGASVRLTDAQRLDWLRLIRSENVGPRTFRALINHYGGAGAALAALPELSRKRVGKPVKIALLADCEREMEALARMGAQLIALGEPDYPAALRAIDAPPPVIAARGRIDVLHRTMVAIVGSRNASASGLAFTERLAHDIAAAGHVIVSGLARGIDARAHRATIATGSIAVLAGGLDRVYPAEHGDLLEDLLEQGAAISEMPLGWDPRGRDFPRRNRIVSGLALGTVVVEAAQRSGSLITARFALEQGREVFAVPGSPLDPRAAGTNDLLRQGATLCTCAADVLDAIAPLVRDGLEARPILREDERQESAEPLWDESDLFGDLPAPETSPGFELDETASDLPSAGAYPAKPVSQIDVRARVIELLGPSPVSVDDLIRAAECPVSRVRTALLELELEGRLERHGGDLVSLLAPR